MQSLEDEKNYEIEHAEATPHVLESQPVDRRLLVVSDLIRMIRD